MSAYEMGQREEQKYRHTTSSLGIHMLVVSVEPGLGVEADSKRDPPGGVLVEFHRVYAGGGTAIGECGVSMQPTLSVKSRPETASFASRLEEVVWN
jgi:hypothetical protein